MAASFLQDLASEAKAREIVVVEPRKARYLVRGYLSATATADGATLEYVWDVFGPDKQRAQRLNDVISVKGAGDDPWAIAGEAALTERRRQERRRSRGVPLQHAGREADSRGRRRQRARRDRNGDGLYGYPVRG